MDLQQQQKQQQTPIGEGTWSSVAHSWYSLMLATDSVDSSRVGTDSSFEEAFNPLSSLLSSLREEKHTAKGEELRLDAANRAAEWLTSVDIQSLTQGAQPPNSFTNDGGTENTLSPVKAGRQRRSLRAWIGSLHQRLQQGRGQLSARVRTLVGSPACPPAPSKPAEASTGATIRVPQVLSDAASLADSAPPADLPEPLEGDGGDATVGAKEVAALLTMWPMFFDNAALRALLDTAANQDALAFAGTPAATLSAQLALAGETVTGLAAVAPLEDAMMVAAAVVCLSYASAAVEAIAPWAGNETDRSLPPQLTTPPRDVQAVLQSQWELLQALDGTVQQLWDQGTASIADQAELVSREARTLRVLALRILGSRLQRQNQTLPAFDREAVQQLLDQSAAGIAEQAARVSREVSQLRSIISNGSSSSSGSGSISSEGIAAQLNSPTFSGSSASCTADAGGLCVSLQTGSAHNDGAGWTVPLEARLYRRDDGKHGTLLNFCRQLLFEKLHGITEFDSKASKLYEERARLILRSIQPASRTSELALRQLEFRAGTSQRWRSLPALDARGAVSTSIKISDAEIALPDLLSGRVTIELRLRPTSTELGSNLGVESFPLVSSTADLVSPEGLTVISDIDDTVKVTDVFRGREAVLRNTFLHDYRAVPGMPELYRKWASELGASFQYVSKSPPALHQPLLKFLTTSGFPISSMHLCPLMSLERKSFKTRTIEKILEAFPKRQVVLVGDSGERDPEIYAALLRQHPKQIVKVFIREVDPSHPVDPVVFDGIRTDRWQVFRDPTKVVLPDPVKTPVWHLQHPWQLMGAVRQPLPSPWLPTPPRLLEPLAFMGLVSEMEIAALTHTKQVLKI
eukprot:CAMPEP_0172684410 /NCGR_PEP_ID=MMETSP1074-20121228/19535_1 /TAXON_ID=2916 /ORGANISM="Ceratium fusus, Strain PA161109" /LENGTH=858 /DNA_ID=CAMNT_0013503417 /DNA_START=257 /DNA_END=2833 /DNA_ORIENTATION=+